MDEKENNKNKERIISTTDKTPANINYHSGFLSGLEVLLWPYRDQIEILPEQWLSTQGIRMDVLILKKDPSVIIDSDICRIFKTNNILEYKRGNDSLSVDVYAKVMAYANLYKSQGSAVDSIPYNEISATIYRHSYPREAFKKLEELGAKIEEKHPGVYYVSGNQFFPVQVLVGRQLDPKEYAMFRVLVSGASDDDIRMFKDMAIRNKDTAYQKSVDNIFQVSVSANKETYKRLMKEDPDMCDALRDLMKDEFRETEARGISTGKIIGYVEGQRDDGKSDKVIINRLMSKYGLSEDEAKSYVLETVMA